MFVSRPRIFKVDFNPSSGIFVAGQTMSGRVHIVTDSVIKSLSGIRLSFHGGAKVDWTETTTVTTPTKNPSPKTELRHYKKSENYFEFQTFVYGDGSSYVDFSPNEYSFPFSFPLPVTSPSSFSHEHGNVRYTVKATLEMGRLRQCVDTESAFTIVGILDLNLKPESLVEKHKTMHKHLGFLFWKTGPISASVHLPKTGYVPGENILISAEIDNKTSRAMSSTYAKLIQRVTFSVPGRSRETSRTMSELKRGRIEAESEDIWRNVAFPIPLVAPPSRLPYCSIIDVEYFLQFGVEPSGIGMDLVVEIPILIGTIPNYGRQPAQNSMMTQSMISSNFEPQMVESIVDGFMDVSVVGQLPTSSLTTATTSRNTVVSSPDFPPPSYEETFGPPSSSGMTRNASSHAGTGYTKSQSVDDWVFS